MDVIQKLERDIYRLNDLVHEIRAYKEKEMYAAYYDLVKHHPFLDKILYDYNEVLTGEKFTMIIYDLVLIWQFFNPDPKARKMPQGDKLFESIKLKNRQFLKYIAGEDNEEAKFEIVKNEMTKLRSEPLLNIIYSKYYPGEVKYDGVILLDLQSLVEYFDTVVFG